MALAQRTARQSEQLQAYKTMMEGVLKFIKLTMQVIKDAEEGKEESGEECDVACVVCSSATHSCRTCTSKVESGAAEGPAAETGTEPEGEQQPGTESEPTGDAGPVAEAEPESEPSAEPEAEAQLESAPEPEEAAAAEPEAAPDAEPEAATDAEPEAAASAETEEPPAEVSATEGEAPPPPAGPICKGKCAVSVQTIPTDIVTAEATEPPPTPPPSPTAAVVLPIEQIDENCLCEIVKEIKRQARKAGIQFGKPGKSQGEEGDSNYELCDIAFKLQKAHENLAALQSSMSQLMKGYPKKISDLNELLKKIGISI